MGCPFPWGRRARCRSPPAPPERTNETPRVKVASRLRGRRLEELAQVGLDDLAVGVARQGLGPEDHLHRHLEGRQPFGDEGAELVLRRMRPGLEGHDGPRLLAEGAVRYTDQSGVHDGEMV